MASPDQIITTADKLIGDENNYITAKQIFDSKLIDKAECFQIPGKSEFFVDLLFYLNRRYRRRLAFSELSASKNGCKTKVFKRVTGVFVALEKLGVTETTFYTGKGVQKRIMELHENN